MREIKFRAWYEGDEEMLYADNHWLTAQMFAQRHDEEFPIMQYTGLKDKNGNEIYEGDVIVCNGAIVDKGAMIQWSEHHACWSIGEDWPWSDFYDGAKGQVEVIGNIYENPELLEGEE